MIGRSFVGQAFDEKDQPIYPEHIEELSSKNNWQLTISKLKIKLYRYRLISFFFPKKKIKKVL